jgi:hypothetical protein
MKEFFNKNKPRGFFLIGLVVVLILLAASVCFYFWLGNRTLARVGDYNITKKVVLDKADEYKDYVLSVKGEDANVEKEVFQIILEEKATSYEANKLGISVSEQELADEIMTLSTDGNTDSYYKSVLAVYGWDKAEADRQVKNRMLKEKLENQLVTSYDVKHFFVRVNVKPLQNETDAQIKAKALELITSAHKDVSSKTFDQIKQDITATAPTWNGDMTHGWGQMGGLNASNEAEKLASDKYWPEIMKLTNTGDLTKIIDLTDQGGLYIFWQLERKNVGDYQSMDEFYQSFVTKSSLDNFVLKFTPKAYAACNNYSNERVIAHPDEIESIYLIPHFQIKIRDASTHALILDHPDARVKTTSIEGEEPNPHCDATWCNMDQDDAIGDNGAATMLDACCQFTYQVEITGLTGHTYVHAHRQGNQVPPGERADLTTHYPPHFNGINSATNMYGQLDFNPVPTPHPCSISTFTASPTTGKAPLAVAFAGTAMNASSTSLNFGDSSPAGIPGNHTYNSAGTYNATFSCTGVGGNDSETIPITVTPPPPPLQLTCSSEPQKGLAPLSIRVTVSGGVPPYDFVMEPTITLFDRQSPILYTYGSSGLKNITVKDSSSPIKTCPVNVTVDPPTSGTGGEVAP